VSSRASLPALDPDAARQDLDAVLDAGLQREPLDVAAIAAEAGREDDATVNPRRFFRRDELLGLMKLIQETDEPDEVDWDAPADEDGLVLVASERTTGTVAIRCDLNQIDETGHVWTLLDNAPDPSLIQPGAVVLAGYPEEPVLARVVDIFGEDPDQLMVHLDVHPGPPSTANA
jgi:hypothetical protein